METSNNSVALVPPSYSSEAIEEITTKSYYESFGFTAPRATTPAIGPNGKLTFFILPAEIRNQIFGIYNDCIRVNIGPREKKQMMPTSIRGFVDTELVDKEFKSRHENSTFLHQAMARSKTEDAQAKTDLAQADEAIAQASRRVETASKALCDAQKALGKRAFSKKETCSERQRLHNAKLAEAAAQKARAKALHELEAITARRANLHETRNNYWGGLHMANKQMYAETLSLRYRSAILNASGDCSGHSSLADDIRPHSLFLSLTRLTPGLTQCIRVLRLSAQVDAKPLLKGVDTFNNTAWDRLCTTAARSLPSLETLYVVLHIRGEGLAFTFKEHWVQSLFAFRDCLKLKWTWVMLRTDVLDEQYALDEKTRPKPRAALVVNGIFLGPGPPAPTPTPDPATQVTPAERQRQRQRNLLTRRKFAACQDLHKEFGHALAGKLLGVDDDEALAKYIPLADDHRAQYFFDFCPWQITGKTTGTA